MIPSLLNRFLTVSVGIAPSFNHFNATSSFAEEQSLALKSSESLELVGKTNKNAVEFAKGLEASGASMIAVHGRTRAQLYGGGADREVIKNVKSALHIAIS